MQPESKTTRAQDTQACVSPPVEPPEAVYMFDMGEGFVWCDEPQPDYEQRDVWEYKRVRKVQDAGV